MTEYRDRSWTDPRIQVRTSGIEGKAGFATSLIHEGEAVVVIGGTVFTDAEFREFVLTGVLFDAIQIGEDRHLVDLTPDSRATNGSLNHSCDSNLWMRDEVTLVARRDILPGEELTVDYALFTAVPDWVLEVPCACGSPVCRHTITGNDWQFPEVQERYRDHFSPFINARIIQLDAASS